MGCSEDVATAIARLILLETGPDQLAAEIFDLVGDGAFEAIQDLLSVRRVSFEIQIFTAYFYQICHLYDQFEL